MILSALDVSFDKRDHIDVRKHASVTKNAKAAAHTGSQLEPKNKLPRILARKNIIRQSSPFALVWQGQSGGRAFSNLTWETLNQQAVPCHRFSAGAHSRSNQIKQPIHIRIRLNCMSPRPWVLPLQHIGLFKRQTTSQVFTSSFQRRHATCTHAKLPLSIVRCHRLRPNPLSPNGIESHGALHAESSHKTHRRWSPSSTPHSCSVAPHTRCKDMKLVDNLLEA